MSRMPVVAAQELRRRVRQFLHAAGRRPAERAVVAGGVGRPADDRGAVARRGVRLAVRAAERAQILHAGAGGPAERARVGAEPRELTDNDLRVSGDTPRLTL